MENKIEMTKIGQNKILNIDLGDVSLKEAEIVVRVIRKLCMQNGVAILCGRRSGPDLLQKGL